jgi:hypothetical protein
MELPALEEYAELIQAFILSSFRPTFHLLPTMATLLLFLSANGQSFMRGREGAAIAVFHLGWLSTSALLAWHLYGCLFWTADGSWIGFSQVIACVLAAELIPAAVLSVPIMLMSSRPGVREALQFRRRESVAVVIGVSNVAILYPTVIALIVRRGADYGW